MFLLYFQIGDFIGLKNKFFHLFSCFKKHFLKKYYIFISVSGFILITSFLNLISERKTFSETENRYLQQKPKFSLNKFFQNNGNSNNFSSNFSSKYEEFINDQFVFRDKWISIKTFSELMLLLKTENNNIIIGKDNYLFDKLQQIDSKQTNKNLTAIKNFVSQNKSKKIYFSIIPNSYEILKNQLPQNLTNVSQEIYINKFYENLYNLSPQENSNLTLIDSFKILRNKNINKNQKIYYCTDHHWTTYGAYLFYQQLAQTLNLNPVNLSNFIQNKVKNFYGTYYSRAKIFWKQPDEIVYYDFPINCLVADNKKHSSLYNLEKFNQKTKDKYSGFLHGNNGLTIINSNTDSKKINSDKKTDILIIKDSYANSLAPFLTQNFNKIYLIDLRYISSSDLKNFFKNHEINNILIIYNFINFVSDNNICKLSDIPN